MSYFLLSKIFTGIGKTQCNEENKKLVDEKIGFKKYKSTVDHMFFRLLLVNQQEDSIVYLLIFRKNLIVSHLLLFHELSVHGKL